MKNDFEENFLMQIEKLIRKSDFSVLSKNHKQELKRTLLRRMESFPESELLQVVAAGEDGVGHETVSPGGACKHGIKQTMCLECEYLYFQSGIWYCRYKNN